MEMAITIIWGQGYIFRLTVYLLVCFTDILSLVMFPGFYLTTVCCIPKLPGAITEPYTPTDIDDDFEGEAPHNCICRACADVDERLAQIKLHLSAVMELQPPEEFPFPFQPYCIQKRFMRALYSALEKGYIGIFESPTGTVSPHHTNEKISSILISIT